MEGINSASPRLINTQVWGVPVEQNLTDIQSPYPSIYNYQGGITSRRKKKRKEYNSGGSNYDGYALRRALEIGRDFCIRSNHCWRTCTKKDGDIRGTQRVSKVLLNAYTYTNSKEPLASTLEEEHPWQEEAAADPTIPPKEKENEHNAEETYALANISWHLASQWYKINWKICFFLSFTRTHSKGY